MNTKKGISPLIATVLLIGFSVALAAVVMTWGLDYVKNTQKNVGDKTEQFLQCSDLNFEISGVDCAGDRITIQNNANVDIANVTLRLYAGDDLIPISGDGIPAFGNTHYTAPTAGVSKVEAMVSLQGDNGVIDCPNNIKQYLSACP
jgi:flagellin-like protein